MIGREGELPAADLRMPGARGAGFLRQLSLRSTSERLLWTAHEDLRSRA
jgi:response regulator RpfG family c-di-GMP phosphodiesterase